MNNVISQLVINNDDIVAFYDTTLFGSGKNGIAICEGGLYWKNVMESPRYLSWNQVRKYKISYNDTNIFIGDGNSLFAYNTEVEKVVNLLNKIRLNEKVENIARKTEVFFGFLEKAASFVEELSQALDDSSNNNVSNNNIDNNIECNNKLISGEVEKTSVEEIIEVKEFNIVEDNTQWYLATKNSKVGPYNTLQAKQWIENNIEVEDIIYVWKKGMENWGNAEGVAEFKDCIRKCDDMPPLPNF